MSRPPVRVLENAICLLSGDHAGSKSFAGLLVDRKSTRLNSSHLVISYAVFCLKKKNIMTTALSLLMPYMPFHTHLILFNDLLLCRYISHSYSSSTTFNSLSM